MSTWAIILAAGGSTRFGSPKALAKWQGGTLLSNVLDSIHPVVKEKFVVVTGGYRAQLVSFLPPGVEVFNQNWSEGLGTSIAAGAKQIISRDPKVSCVLIVPIDQPLITSQHLTRLEQRARERSCPVFTKDCDRIGPPAAVSGALDILLALTGQHGLKQQLGNRSYETIDGTNLLTDVDTVGELETLARARALI